MEDYVSFSADIVSTDKFYSMPVGAQCLYFHLMVGAGAKGIVNNALSIMRSCDCEMEHLEILMNQGYVKKIAEYEYQIVHYYQNLKSDKEQRLTGGYLRWRKAVIERDKCCVKCGSKEKLVAHHIKPFAQYPELRLDVDNGVTLCELCHRRLHGLIKE